MVRFFTWIVSSLCVAVVLSACGSVGADGGMTPAATPDSSSGSISETGTAQLAPQEETNETEEVPVKMNVQIGTYTVTATLEDNDAVRELVEMMRTEPVTIHMSDYAGFEKVGPLGRSLTTSNSQTTTAAGDIVLYNGNNIVIFYGSNSWSYTRIGKIDDLTDWEAVLGGGDITAIFSLAE